MELPPHSRIQESPHRAREDRANPEARACGIEVMWQASDIGHTPTQLNSTQLNSTHTSNQGNRVALPSCSLLSFFIGYVAHVTREDAQGWGGVEHTHTHPSVATRLRRERETHTHARGELAYTPILASSPLHILCAPAEQPRPWLHRSFMKTTGRG